MKDGERCLSHAKSELRNQPNHLAASTSNEHFISQSFYQYADFYQSKDILPSSSERGKCFNSSLVQSNKNINSETQILGSSYHKESIIKKQILPSKTIKIRDVPEWMIIKLYHKLHEYGKLIKFVQNPDNKLIVYAEFENKLAVENAFRQINTSYIFGSRLKASYIYHDLQNLSNLNGRGLYSICEISDYKIEESSSGSSSANGNSRSQSSEHDSKFKKILNKHVEKLREEYESLCDNDNFTKPSNQFSNNELDNNITEQLDKPIGNTHDKNEEQKEEDKEDNIIANKLKLEIGEEMKEIKLEQKTNSQGILRKQTSEESNFLLRSFGIASDQMHTNSGCTSARENSLNSGILNIQSSSLAQLKNQNSVESHINLNNVKTDPALKHSISHDHYQNSSPEYTEHPYLQGNYFPEMMPNNTYFLKNYLFNTQVAQMNSNEFNMMGYNERTLRLQNSYRVPIPQEEMSLEIDINKILNNQDARTTVMIRNIPNKYDQKDVLKIIDSKGMKNKYDIFYLPIDFTNICNYGYAFINLIDPLYVVQLYLELNNKSPWDHSNSSKVCQLKYGTIQGKNGLINHFKKSPIMLQKEKKYKPVGFISFKKLSVHERILLIEVF